MALVYWNLIGDKTKSVLFRLRDAGILREYYLSGGTALTLQLGHRVSEDLDFFTKRASTRLPVQSLISRCEKAFGKEHVAVRLYEVDQVWMDIEGVHVTFLAFPFDLKYRLLRESGIHIANIRDIALQKAYAIGRRARTRDYIDLAYILEDGAITLEELISDAQSVFRINGDPVFSPRLFLQQLTYTEDLADREDALRLLVRKRSFEAITDFLKTKVREAVQSMVSEGH
ncbi:Domain of unknown function DUF1814 [Thermaerobacter marianensis DSM 12885]|uniref:Nucleotidyl transferase AbiEii/AbiGii toxin family protein n=1 Tax=Thermaerobacter marianensis (strain ATCC 700841 / DSM 12885 / JCM 10246 / 7p75a) TaxID=644966 RepID=E6SHJ8_THEM7|nr:nucleotidyl transferase AbiEii/AbiGii toxin family protein [Thermaerobacter marianensis]ADU51793.1 Domain of unknown function DUF1814 [Thermaerobacter marianensis DSM 12885]